MILLVATNISDKLATSIFMVGNGGSWFISNVGTI